MLLDILTYKSLWLCINNTYTEVNSNKNKQKKKQQLSMSCQ